MSNNLPTRQEIDEKYKWDVHDIYPDDDQWEAAIKSLHQDLESIRAYKGKLGDSSETLAAFLALSNQITVDARRIMSYASLQTSVDMNNKAAVAMRSRAMAIVGQVMADMAFGSPEILQIEESAIADWMANSAALQPFSHQLDRILIRRPYTRNHEVEELLGMLNDVFSTATATHGILANAELPFEPAIDADGNTFDVAQGTIRGLVAHPDRQVRRSGYENYADTHLAFKDTMANALAAGIKRNVFYAKARGYENALDASLRSDYIPAAVFDNLLNTFQKNLPTWHKYWAIRRQAFGYDELFEYDVKNPLSLQPPHLTYEDAVDLICAGMAPLGDEYVTMMRRGCLEERWVDVFPNQGKRMGAFSSGVPHSRPFIMMSFTPDLFGMSTLAHELGHSMHSRFTQLTQTNPFYYGYGLFAAEVASNFNQALVRHHLFATNDDREYQIAVIDEAMANFYRYFFVMPTLARFEKAIHERVESGRSLTADYLIKLMADLFREGYGDVLTFDEERIGITWAEFHTHLYSNFYVYKYATGIAAAHALADSIINGGQDDVDRYLGFLKAGGSDYPLNILKTAGVDMSSPEPVEKGFAVLASHVDRLESLINARP